MTPTHRVPVALASAAAIPPARPAAMSVPPGRKHNASFQQTMLRIKDPSVSVPFYEKHFGMRCVHRCDFPQWKFSLYFLERVRDAEAGALAEPGTIESEAYLWSMKGATLELTHNHGSENDDNFSVWSGNSGSDLPADSPLHMAGGPIRGFGHIAFNVPDVYALSASLEADGVRFQKRPDEGRMKGLAFCLDPDGYWIELGARAHARARAPRPVLRARVPPPPPSPTPTPLGPSLPSASRSAGRRLRRADQPLADDDARQGRGEDEGVLHGRARPHARARDARAKRLL